MSEQQNISQVEVPSMAKIVTATVTALIVASVILITVVLPAEYGIDPLGTGRALGLTDLGKASGRPPERPAPETPTSATDAAPTTIVPVLVPSPTGDAPRVMGTFISQPSRYRIDSREITLAPAEGMEIKYNMKKGAGLVYSWTASEALAFEFHGEPDVKPAGKGGTDYYESYELDDKTEKTRDTGRLWRPAPASMGGSGKTRAPTRSC